MKAILALPDLKSPDNDVKILWKVKDKEFDIVKQESSEFAFATYFYEQDFT